MTPLELLLTSLAALRTPALLALVVITVAGYFKLKRVEEQVHELGNKKADLQAVNNLGGKVRRLEKEFGSETSKTRIAVATIASKIDSPQVITDFLKQDTQGP